MNRNTPDVDDVFSDKWLKLAGELVGFRRLVGEEMSCESLYEISNTASGASGRHRSTEDQPPASPQNASSLEKPRQRYLLAAAAAVTVLAVTVLIAIWCFHTRAPLHSVVEQPRFPTRLVESQETTATVAKTTENAANGVDESAVTRLPGGVTEHSQAATGTPETPAPIAERPVRTEDEAIPPNDPAQLVAKKRGANQSSERRENSEAFFAPYSSDVESSSGTAAQYAAGDLVVTTNESDLRDGRNTIARLGLGEVLVVQMVRHDWLLVEKDGAKGWVHSRYVRDASATAASIHVPGHRQALAKTGRPCVILANEFFDLRGSGKGPGGIIIGGTTRGPHGRGGEASCRMDLPEDSSATKLRITICHGLAGEFGKGVHSQRKGGKVSIYVNDSLVDTIVCLHRGIYGDYWPEPQPELGREIPEVDLRGKGINGRFVTIKFLVSPGTCMDLRSVTVEPWRR